MRLPWICPFALFLAAAPALSAAPALLRDFHPGLETFPAELAANGLTDAAGFHYFVAGDPAHGRELWRSDGTAAGTIRLTDVCPGPCPGAPVLLALAHGRVFFTADDGASGRELWSSGPDPAGSSGAERVRDLCPGPCGGDPASAAVLGDDLYFLAWSAPHRVALWRSDGTRGGTRPLAEICASCTTLPSYGRFLPHISRFRNRVLFTGPDPEAELWESDGTAAGTFPVRQRFTFPPDPFGLTTAAFDDQHFFFVTGEGELFETDLTPEGTHLVRSLAEIVPISDVVSISWIQAFAFRNGRFFARVGGGLIASDGTHDGTILLKSFLHSNTLAVLSLQAAVLVVDGHDALYTTGGTPETTVELLDLGDSHFIDSIAQVGDRAFFIKSSRDSTQPARELWVTDGSAAGTHRIGGAPAMVGSFGPPLVPIPGPLYFVEREDGGDSGTRLWRSDGGEAGTFPVHEFGDVPASGGPLAQARLGGKLLFSARTSATDAPLFATDGTAAGTSVLSPADAWGRDFVRVGSQLVFNTVTPATPWQPSGGGSGVWRTDGTAVGTRRLSIGRVFSPTVFGGVLLYAAELSFSPAGSSEMELFSTDGTRRGTGLLADINPFRSDNGIHHGCYGASSDPGPGVAIGNRAVFAADDGWHGRELFVTNGTRRGTVLVRDIDPGRIPEPPSNACITGSSPQDQGRPSSPESFVAYRSGALFTADDGRTGRELWWTDGTAQGTRRVRDLKPGPQGSSPHDLVAFGGKVYFVAAAGAGTTGGEALWRTDGTAAGTVRVADLTLAGSPSWASRLTAVGGKLFFTVYNEETGSELWVTGGDTASTHLVADLHPGPSGAAPQALTDIQGILVFAADDGVSGLEPWRSDGTAAGTRPLGDINPGPAASSPGPFDRVGTVVLTGADDGIHGREPWVIPLAEILAS